VWAVGTMGAGTSATLTLQMDRSPDSDQMVNAASVTSSTPDPKPANNSVSLAVPNLKSADLAASLSLVSNAQGVVTFAVTVRNNGPSTATGVQVTGLAPGALFVSGNPSQGTFSLVPPRWDVGSLAPGDTATLTVTVSVTAALGLGPLNISVSAGSAVSDPDPSNNVAVLQVPLPGVGVTSPPAPSRHF